MPPEHSSQEAFAAARTALLKADATPLFWCERRDCGSSSLLANAVFGNAKLYGPDEQQAYLLVRLAAPQENSLVAVYSITRGNRRAYLQAEELKADAPLAELLPSPATLLRLLKANGELTLSHVPAEPAGSLVGAAGADPAPGYRGAGRAVRQARPGVARRPARAGRAEQPHGAGPVGGRGPAPQLAALNAFARACGPGRWRNAFGKAARQSRLPFPRAHAPAGNGARRALSIGVSPFEEGLP